MKVKGICKDCKYRWQLGAKGQPQHLYCNHVSNAHIVKNHNMKSCKYYEYASEETMKCIQLRTRK